MLKYTGHPFIDVGVATIVAMCNLESPLDFNEQHFHKLKEELLRIYITPAMGGYIGNVVFGNASFANPAKLNEKYFDSNRSALSQLIDWASSNPVIPSDDAADEGEQCTFSGDPAIIRASRMLIPMTNSEDAINFVPEGRKRLPVAGWCILALLAMPIGALNTGGALWIVHSHNHELTEHFASEHVAKNRATFSLSSLDKLPNYKFTRTMLIEELMAAHNLRPSSSPLTAYTFSSNAQNARLTIHHLPSQVVSFMVSAKRQSPQAWNFLVKSSKDRQPETAEKKQGDKTQKHYQRRYFLYEDLFELPQRATYFLRRYLLRKPKGGQRQKSDPRYEFSPLRDVDGISWGLIALFLERIMTMDKQRIEDIRAVADNLAHFAQVTGDDKLLKRLMSARSGYDILHLLKRASLRVEGGEVPLITFDQAVSVFFFDEDADNLRFDWRLARDLLVIRMIERLQQAQSLRPELAKELAEIVASADEAEE